MFKVFVLSVLFAVVYAKPGYLALPVATSHASRVDIIHPQPIVKAYHGYGGFDHGYHGYDYPLSHSYANRVEYHGHAAPLIGHIGFGHLGYGQVGHVGHLGHGGWAY